MLVSIITPCRNEADHLDQFLAGALSQRLPRDCALELLVADGRSDDATRAMLEDWAAADSRIILIDNPRLIVSAGLNRAVRLARGEVIVRMDVHTEYAQDYVAECLRALEESGADNVGGPWRARGSGGVSDAIALAFSCRWVSGGGKAHDPSYEGPVDTVYLGCWRREAFGRFGRFDEDLARGQDSEFNYRVLHIGGRVYQTPRIRSWYAPRSSLSQLFRQYMQYGYWKVAMLRKHGRPTSLRQLAPGAFLVGLIGLASAAPWFPAAAWLLAAAICLYLLASLAVGERICARTARPDLALAMPAVFAAYHFGFGWGYLCGAVDLLVLRRKPGGRFAALTRGSALSRARVES